MPWVPELFSAPVLQRFLDKQQRDTIVDVPFFDGLIAGETDALVGSFAGEPEVHHPVRGRIKGVKAFTAFVAEMSAWFAEHNVEVEDVERVVLSARGFEEVLLRVDGEGGPGRGAVRARRRSPGGGADRGAAAVLVDRAADRPPHRPPAPAAARPGSAPGGRRRGVSAGARGGRPRGGPRDVRAGWYARAPTGAAFHGTEGLRAFFGRLFSNGGGIPLEHCAVVDDGRACALEFNVVRWGRTELPPQPGVAVYVRGSSGKLAAARIYDDADPPLA